MTKVLQIHPDNPQPRLLRRVAEALGRGAVMAYPTDSAYGLGCQLGNKDGWERIRRIRGLDKHHNFTLICRDLSELSQYARVDNAVFRLLKAYTPGVYTFILPATREVPRRLLHPKRKTIGLRVPDHRFCRALLDQLAVPLMSVTLTLPGDTVPLVDIDEMAERLDGRVDLIIDSGHASFDNTSVIDLTSGTPEILRVGKGDVSELVVE